MFPQLFTITAGPDAGRSFELGPGVHLAGRARQCAFAIDDPDAEPYHVAFDVCDGGPTRVMQITGHVPIEVDGIAISAGAGCVTIRDVVEFGSSRIEIATQTDDPGCDDPIRPVVFDRAERVDLLLAQLTKAGRACRRLYLSDRVGLVVSLGVGRVRLPIPLVDARGERLEPAQLPLQFQPLVERAETHAGVPVLADVAGGSVGIVDHGAIDDLRRTHRVAHWMTFQAGRQLPLVITQPGDSELDRCAAVLEIGSRWRGRWTPDMSRPDESIRLHVAGRSSLSR